MASFSRQWCFYGVQIKHNLSLGGLDSLVDDLATELLVLLELEAVKVSVGGTLGTGSDLLGPGGLGPGASKVGLLNGSLEGSLASATGNLDDQGGQGQAAESVARAGNAGGGALNESLKTEEKKTSQKNVVS